MDHFEYLMVMVSIILGLGATQALRGLSKMAQNPRPYAPVALWAATLFYLHIQIWWGYWDMAGVTDWTQLTFYLIVFLPCALFAAIELLMPIGAGAKTDWEEHFLSVRLWFFATLIAFQFVATISSYIINDVPLTHPYRVFQILVMTIATIGFFTKSARVHTWVAGTYLIVMLTGQVIFRLTPGLGE